jgi:adenylate kinase
MIIAVTGTPGSGKTYLSKKISKRLNLKYISGNFIIKKYGLAEAYDKKRNCNIVNVNTFVSSCLKECKRYSSCVVDSHMSHFISNRYVSLCVICITKLNILKQRLEKRGYSHAKVRENLDAEIFETCQVGAKMKGHSILLFNGNYSSVEKKIIKKLKSLR